MTDDDEDRPGGFASPPCFAHEIDPAYFDPLAVDPQQALDVARWRKAERKRLIAARLEEAADMRARLAQNIAVELDQIIAPATGRVISVYWPFRGEIDLRGWMRSAFDKGAQIALPVVVEKHQPLQFREWTPDAAMERGIWNILQPADPAPVTPNVVIAPLVGFDPACFRLGYGGGFFDRTLAAMATPPLVIGVGSKSGAIASIFPQPHDVAMDVIVTGAGDVRRRKD